MKTARGLALLGALFIAGPMFIVLPMSFSTSLSLEFPPPGYGIGYYQRFFHDANWTQPLINSIVIGLGTMVLTMLIAVPAAFALVRHDFRGKSLFNGLVLLPLIVPHIVMAMGYYSYFGSLRLVQTYTGVILAHTCLAIPVSTLVLTAALKTFDRNLERAAASLGATPLATLRLVTFPVMRPAFLIAALFAFVHSFDETVIALFISGGQLATLPRQMFNSFFMQPDPVIAAASSMLFAMVLLGIGVSMAPRLMRRRGTAAVRPLQPVGTST
jgi:putative spermidine/putrescine transport system permease protein